MTRISTVDLGRVFTSAPINKTASRVTSKGDGYELRGGNTADSEFPIQTYPMPRMVIKNMIGAIKGRLTVVGWVKPSKTKGDMWSCRCCCGWFTVRSTKAIENPNNTDDCCTNCRELQFLKRNESQRRLGLV